ncbi:MAG: filamentous hemagglutinin N-terminal domain-containing protein [Proteobacteria bacterium]|nr:filamentous hemagglutinin N-terminal domain-containing protein [Pseudomonadota bacterium]
MRFPSRFGLHWQIFLSREDNFIDHIKDAKIDWRSFDIGSKAQVNFNQPGTSSIAVNRVNSSANPTQIEGGLHANGQVWILNPNGVFFSKTAHVDAAGIVASTANIDTNAFMAGSNKLQMTGADHGSVENQGNISVGANGLAAFVAPSVRNSGTINATVGRVALAAGTTYTLDLAGDHLVELGLGSVKAVVDSSGKIVNPGGTIALTAKAAGQVVNSVVNVSGVVSASSVTKSGGTITLGGDNVTTTSTAQLSADAGTNGNGGAITSVANVQGNYAGSFSAKGGSASGNGGSVETSGKSVHVDSGIKINTLASNGLTGSWTVDPDNLTIGTTDSGADADTDQSISASTVESQLGTTSVNLKANNTITVNTAIDTSSNTDSNTLTFQDENGSGLTINLNADITLGAHETLTGQGTIVNVANTGLIQNGIDVALAGGATVNVAAGQYAAGTGLQINKSGLTLLGASGAEIDVNPGTSGQVNAITIGGSTDGVTISGFDIRGEVNAPYTSYAWGSAVSRGVAVLNGATNVTITDNDIRNVRNGILIDGRNTGSVTNNVIDNTKSAISVQYTDAGLGNTEGYVMTMTGNSQGTDGNEWGVNFHLNGHYVGSTYYSNSQKIATNATTTVQQALLAFKTANNGLTAQDQGYSQSNRTDVTVSTTGSDTNQGSPLNNLATIPAGVNAVVAGGTVNVLGGNYTLSGELDITKSLSLIGAGVGVTNITSASTGYGIFVDADNTTLSGFTYNGSAAGSYSFKIQAAPGSASNRLQNFNINNVSISGSKKTGLDLNGVLNATIDHVTVTGTTGGNGIALTDSANVTITNSATTGNAWGGLALYQNNSAFNQQVNNIVVGGTNTFAEGIYAQDQSATNDFGTINLTGQGIEYVGTLNTGGADGTYTFFQKTEQGAIDATTAFNTRYSSTAGTVQGYDETSESVNGNNVFYVGYNTGSTAALSIAAANSAASNGATINVLGGNYTLSGELDVTKSLTLSGAGVGVTNITSTSTGYGINVTADNTSLKNFTYHGPTAVGSTYGIKVTPDTNVASDRLLNFDIENVTIDQGYRTGLDLNGVLGATIKNVNVSNIVHGNGMALTDSANVTITGSTTSNNAWGGLALYQTNNYYDQQVNNITVDGTNTFNEAKGIYAEDQSTTEDYGTLNLAGYDFIAQWQAGVNDFYTFFQKTEQAAIDMAVAVSPTTSYVQGYAGNGEVGNNVFYVGYNTANTGSLSIATAVGAASNGATIDVLAGNYTLSGELDITKGLSLVGAGVGVTNITSTSTGYGINVTGDNVSLQNFTYHGPTAATGSTYGIKVQPDTGVASDRLLNFDIENVTIDQGYRTGLDLNGVLGATIKNVNVSNIVHGNGMALTDSANVTITGSTTSNNAWGGLALYQTNKYYDQQVNNITVDGTNTFNDTIPVYTEDQSASQNFGSISLAGFNYVVQSPNNANDVYSWFQKTEQAAFDFATNAALSNNNVNVPTATVQGYSGSGAYGNNVFYVGTGSNAVALSIGNAVSQAASGGTINVSSGTYAEDVTAAKQLAFNFGDVTVNSLTLASGAAGSALNGNLTATGAIALGDATTVTGSLKAASFTSNATLAMTGNLTTSGTTALNGASNITGNVAANSLITGNTLALAGNLSATNGVTLGGASTVNGNISAASLTANGALGLTGNLTTSGASALNGASNITGNVQADTLSTGSTLTQAGNIAATNGVTLGGASTITGSVSAKTFAANGTLALNGGLTALGAAQFNGAATVNGNVQAASIAASNSFGLTGNATASGAIALNGANTLAGNLAGGSIALNGATTLAGATTLDTSAANGNIAVASVAGGGQALTLKTGTGTASLGNVANAGSITDLGAVTLTGTQYSAGAETLGAATLTGDTTFNAGKGNVVLASLAGGGHGATIDAGNASLGNVANAGAVAVNGAATLTGSSYSGSSFAFGGPVSLTNDTTLGATGAVTLASLNGGGDDLAITSGAASLGNVANTGALSVTGPVTLTGTSYVAGSIGLGATTLTNNAVLNTSGDNGALVIASIDGSLAGAQSLTLNAGSGSVSLGNLGAATRLGAVSDASKTTLTGSTYNANSFLFGGGVTLTSASTTLNTTQSSNAAGGITFQGDIFGTSDAAQSLTLIAGPGTGAASSNGDITLQNAGTSAVYLGDLTVKGNNFTALTVDVGGNYNATLTGNQVFAADTLNVRGNANSTVGGDASGHIVAGGDVTIVANGGVSGTISGQNVNLTGSDVNSAVTASNAANIQGNTVGGSYTAQAVTLIASNNVDAAVNATDFTLAAQHGSVNGTWTTIDTNGSNVVSVNGQTTVGLANVNPNQLVVEGFVLPAGTTIGANGQLILPQGVLLGLLSPGGGKPKMILVHTVHQLGELLAAGYSVIVIDLSNSDSGKPIELASN